VISAKDLVGGHAEDGALGGGPVQDVLHGAVYVDVPVGTDWSQVLSPCKAAMHHVHAEAPSARERGESQGIASSVAMRPSLAVAPPRWGIVGQLTIWAVKLPTQQKEIRLRSRIRLGAIEARPTPWNGD
jgi:hypothetical protein